jgi:hypothetical protein
VRHALNAGPSKNKFGLPGVMPGDDALRASLRRDDWCVNPPQAPVANTLSQPVFRFLGLFWQEAF